MVKNILFNLTCKEITVKLTKSNRKLVENIIDEEIKNYKKCDKKIIKVSINSIGTTGTLLVVIITQLNYMHKLLKMDSIKALINNIKELTSKQSDEKESEKENKSKVSSKLKELNNILADKFIKSEFALTIDKRYFSEIKKVKDEINDLIANEDIHDDKSLRETYEKYISDYAKRLKDFADTSLIKK
jgi:vacuolar-type H+-ATPase subunit I/STV1